MACPCCVTTLVQVLVNDKNISERVSAISVDSVPDIQWEPKSDDCIPQGTGWIYMYGPGKTTIQITAYPFDPPEDYTFGLPCATNLSVSVPWKQIYDCRVCSPCLMPDGTIGRKLGMWRAIPMRKRQITVTGDISNSPKFIVDGCPIPAPKFQIQANQHMVYLPQKAMQYNHLQYLGGPVAFDTENIKEPFTINIQTQEGCGGFTGDAYLTSFTYSYTPPQVPTVTYSFDMMFSVCPGSC
jgi:hypothetical protein